MSEPSLTGRGFSRRTLLKAGAGLTAGAGHGLGVGLGAAAPAYATNGIGQTGTPLCQNAGGDSASQQGLGCGDLGIPYFRQHDGTWGYVFGDSYRGPNEGDTYIGLGDVEVTRKAGRARIPAGPEDPSSEKTRFRG